MRIFLCGDVMTGRGIDQALPHPCSPILHEGYVQSAVDYLRLAERANGPVPRPSDAFEPKGINYRMSPENGPCLSAAGLDCCVLANNHVLDWGLAGLIDTLNALERLRIKTAGAGRTSSRCISAVNRAISLPPAVRRPEKWPALRPI
jgi:poly-gamma-glutamate synthesis protein (capsule biosynthesis protein)